ncbi:MAG: ATP-binding cassette domain-containing protein [Buchnera aphidicola (Nurudea yanoniella)]
MNSLYLLKCNSIYKSYLQKTILKNISLKLKAGNMMSITGSSGSGKSTLLHIIGGLDVPDSGQVFFLGQNIHNISNKKQSALRNHHLGFVYQLHHLLPDFDVIENVALPLLIQKKNRIKAFEQAYNVLKELKIEEKAKQFPSELSGGERQRVAIARALVTKPSLIIADEPTGHLDKKNSKNFLDLLFKFNYEYNIAVLIVTHDVFLFKNIPLKMELKSGKLYKINA